MGGVFNYGVALLATTAQVSGFVVPTLPLTNSNLRIAPQPSAGILPSCGVCVRRQESTSRMVNESAPAQCPAPDVGQKNSRSNGGCKLHRRVTGAGKLALCAGAAAMVSQVWPHAAVAAQAAVPMVTSSVDGNLVDRLSSSGFFQAFSLVFVSEIGDKTFFIAALLAAKMTRLISFTGSVGALAVMTILAVLLGVAFHSVPAVFTSGLPFDDIIAAAAFLYFGLNTLKDAYESPDNSNEGIEEEKAEAEESVKELGEKKTVWALILQVFSLVFAAEFGDRSFLTTIALGAAQSPVGVATGAIAAHASATGIAVTGGALLSQYISEKLIGYIGGTLFIVFALTTAVGIF